MVVITVESYKNAQVYIITVKNKELFWIKMIDVQNRLDIKIMPDLVRRKICGIFKKNDLKKMKKKKTTTNI